MPGMNGSCGLSWYSPAAIRMSGKLMPAARMATRACPGASGIDAKFSSRSFSGGPSSWQKTALGIFLCRALRALGAYLAALQRLTDQRQPVITEIHIGLVDEDGRRTEPAARHHLVGVGLELVLDRLLADPCEEFRGVDAGALADFRQHRVL